MKNKITAHAVGMDSLSTNGEFAATIMTGNIEMKLSIERLERKQIKILDSVSEDMFQHTYNSSLIFITPSSDFSDGNTG